MIDTDKMCQRMKQPCSKRIPLSPKYGGGFAACVWEWDVGVCEWDLEPDPFLAVGS